MAESLDEDSHDNLIQKEKESIKRLRKMREDLMSNYPNSKVAQEQIKLINSALGEDVIVHVEGLTGLAGVGVNFPIQPFSWNLPGRQASTSRHDPDQASKKKKKRKNKQQLKDGSSGSAFDQHASEIPPIDLQYMSHKSNSAAEYANIPLRRLSSFHDNLAIWKASERLKVDLNLLARDGETAAIKKNIQDGDINDCGLTIDTVRLLIPHDGDFTFRDQYGRSLLHWVCQNGHSAEITPLVKRGLDVNAQDICGQTALHMTSSRKVKQEDQRKHCDIYKALLDTGGDISATDLCGLTPIHLVIREGHTHLMRYLLHNDYPGDSKMKATDQVAMETDTDTGDASSVAMGTTSNTRDAILHADNIIGGTYLLYAIVKGRTAIVKSLLQAGADPNKEGMNLRPLSLAVCREDIETVSNLISGGADVNLADRFGKTPLHLAALMNDLPLVTALVGARVDINSRDAEGCRAIDLFRDVFSVTDSVHVKQQCQEIITLYLVQREANK